MGLPELHAGQKSLLALPGRFRVGICGRRFGKTLSAMAEAVRVCGGGTKKERKAVWWISPVLEQSRRVELELATELQEFNDDGSLKKPQTWKHMKAQRAIVHVESLSRIEFHSAEQGDRLRGAGLDLVILDEAADISEAIWNSVVKPMLLERSGLALIIGTPRGTSNWLHKLYRMAEEKPGFPYGAARMATKENPLIPVDDLELFRADMTDAEYRQEFNAEFIDGVDSVFKNIDACVGEAKLNAGRPGAFYITGIDLGQMEDFTAVVSLRCQADAEGVVRVEGFERFNGDSWAVQCDRIVEHVRRFPGPCVVDATGVGKPIYEYLRGAIGYTVRALTISAYNKMELVQGLSLALEQRRLKLPDARELLGELRSFTRTGWSASRQFPQYGAPNGLHDDCVIALGLAWWGLTRCGLAGDVAGNWMGGRGFYG